MYRYEMGITIGELIKSLNNKQLTKFLEMVESAAYVDSSITPKRDNGYHMDMEEWLNSEASLEDVRFFTQLGGDMKLSNIKSTPTFKELKEKLSELSKENGINKISEFIKENAIDEGFLQDWYQHSVGGNTPAWSDEHIEEVCKDFYLIPKETIDKLGE